MERQRCGETLIDLLLKLSQHLIQAAFRGAERGEFYSLPGSGTGDSLLLANASDIGIPGEWLFKLDGEVNLCAPGFKGLECIEGECKASVNRVKRTLRRV